MLRAPVLAAVVLMALNDHVLKGLGPGVVTGKLSDVAGLVLLPVLLQAWVEVGQAAVGRFSRPSDRLLRWTVSISGLGFALVNTLGPVERLWQVTWGLAQVPARSLAAGSLVPAVPVVHHADATDLLALPAVVVPLLLVSAARRSARSRPTGCGEPSRA